MTNIPFAIGESLLQNGSLSHILKMISPQFARVDICNVGGITESMKVAGWCESHYIDMMPHNPLGPIYSTQFILVHQSKFCLA